MDVVLERIEVCSVTDFREQDFYHIYHNKKEKKGQDVTAESEMYLSLNRECCEVDDYSLSIRIAKEYESVFPEIFVHEFMETALFSVIAKISGRIPKTSLSHYITSITCDFDVENSPPMKPYPSMRRA